MAIVRSRHSVWGRDAEVPDAEVPDAEAPDAEVPDAEVPDAEVPDAETVTLRSEIESAGGESRCRDSMYGSCLRGPESVTCLPRSTV
jgi:hypothetical protein